MATDAKSLRNLGKDGRIKKIAEKRSLRMPRKVERVSKERGF